ncbi:hypothetical protein OM416_09050 [Paenibacillus sp. LS1]|nr:hypothetical protein [Paenibacillus sp. LS1]
MYASDKPPFFFGSKQNRLLNFTIDVKLNSTERTVTFYHSYSVSSLFGEV